MGMKQKRSKFQRRGGGSSKSRKRYRQNGARPGGNFGRRLRHEALRGHHLCRDLPPPRRAYSGEHNPPSPSNKGIYFSTTRPRPQHRSSLSTPTASSTPSSCSPPKIRKKCYGPFHGQVYRARVVRPGHPQDGQLLLEYKVDDVPLKNCECPQPEFVDCSKPPFTGARNDVIHNPVTFKNVANEPLDLFYWNGTCERAPFRGKKSVACNPREPKISSPRRATPSAPAQLRLTEWSLSTPCPTSSSARASMSRLAPTALTPLLLN